MEHEAHYSRIPLARKENGPSAELNGNNKEIDESGNMITGRLRKCDVEM